MTLAVLLGPSSTVGDSCVHVDSPIAFEKEAYHLPYVLTVLRAVLFLLSAGHVYQVVSCIPSELCLSYSDRSIHSRDKSVGCMLDSRVCAYSFLVGSPYWQPHDLGVHKISKFVPHFDNILGRRSNLLICECGRDQRHMFRLPIWRMCSLRYQMPHPSPVRSSQYVWSQHGRPRRRRMEKTPGHREGSVQRGEQHVRVARDNPNRSSISISSNHVEGSATTNVDLRRDLTRETLLVIASASFKANLVSLGQLCVLLEIEVHGRLGVFIGPRFWSDTVLMRFWPVLPARLLISTDS